ncbi:hypothetical protein HanIR_Chr01g0003311 [Helianthus annuus]|nr:hypothetical protein HanIR_Chr01g0003311 [Helianthus annuus]
MITLGFERRRTGHRSFEQSRRRFLLKMLSILRVWGPVFGSCDQESLKLWWDSRFKKRF